MSRVRYRRRDDGPLLDYQSGAFSGYTSFRNGGGRPVTLAGGSAHLAQKLLEAARDTMVERVIDLVTEWKMTLFEHEGPIRAGLRAGFCQKVTAGTDRR